jgi:regulator of sigma E protease
MPGAVGIIVTVLAFALLVVVHEFGHFAMARAFKMRVHRFSVGFGKVLWSRKRGDTEFALSVMPLGGYVAIAGMAPGEQVDPNDPSIYSNQAAWRRFLVILAGPAMNYFAAIVIATVVIAAHGIATADPSARVGDVMAGSRAEQAGLKTGDRVTAVDGKPVESWEALVSSVQSSPEKDLSLQVRRGDAEVSVTAKPEDVGGVGRLGFGQAVVVAEARKSQALVIGFQQVNKTAATILNQLAVLITGRHEGGFRALAGPVGIVQGMARSARVSAWQFISQVGHISIVLALFNLLPIPALDGGRLFFLGYELFTRRRVNQRVESIIHAVGILALFGLMLAVTVFSDVPRLFGR